MKINNLELKGDPFNEKKDKKICTIIVNDNIRRIFSNRPLTMPLKILKKDCEFLKRYNLSCNLRESQHKIKEYKCKICLKSIFSNRVRMWCNSKDCFKQRQREYNQRPEVKQRLKEYNQRPEVKQRLKEYSQRAEVKQKRKEYYQIPKNKQRIKQRVKEYNQRPEVKQRLKEYSQRPEIKERNKRTRQRRLDRQ